MYYVTTLLTVTGTVAFEVKNSQAKKILDCCFLTICPIDFDLAIELQDLSLECLHT